MVSVEGECLWGNTQSEHLLPKETLHPHDMGMVLGPKVPSLGSMLDTADRWRDISKNPLEVSGLMKAFLGR